MSTAALRFLPFTVLFALALFDPCVGRGDTARQFRAGAAAVDITPTEYPVVVNGMFFERKADRSFDRIFARALVLDDGSVRLAIVVVDNLMMPRDLLDRAKEAASRATGIPIERMLISATHAHSTPAAMGCLGSPADPKYPDFLERQIARSIVLAAEKLVAARIGWAVVPCPDHNDCRRWIFRPDRMPSDPFGEKTVRAHMHPGHLSANHIGPAGPADPDLTLLAVQTSDGQPIAVLGNFAMHYFDGSPYVSGDFCGQFEEAFAGLLDIDPKSSPFVGIMSQGTSGDTGWMDYSQPPRTVKLQEYTREVADKAHEAYRQIKFHDWAPLAMAERPLKIKRRIPDAQRLEWAKKVFPWDIARLPTTMQEIYAREALLLHATPEVELKLQAIRIGELGITAIPNEVYGLTGLKLKAQGPLPTTFNIELANGAEGYIPPPEQHALGGYTTWPARTAGLEAEAEPKIVDSLLTLLEQVSERPRRAVTEVTTDYSEAVLTAKPHAYWRLGEMQGDTATDASGNGNHGRFEKGIALYLPGSEASGLMAGGNRAAHFAGGRLIADLPKLDHEYTVSLWLWNGLPADARPITGCVFVRGGETSSEGLSIGGTADAKTAKKLVWSAAGKSFAGRTDLSLKHWHHAAVARRKDRVEVYLDGQKEPEIVATAEAPATAAPRWFFAGDSAAAATLKGRLDEVALFDHPLSPEDLTRQYEAAAHLGSAPNQLPKAADTSVKTVPDPKVPRSLEESLAAWHVKAGFQIELVAAEPLVIDPVAIDWGADGKLWVAEMADYPLGIDGQGKPGGRIGYLEDTEGDGRYDKSTLFLEGVSFPTGVMAWKQGALVTAAPELFYAEDTDGDGKADVRTTLFSGFHEGNQQLRVNGLRWGLDNWVYCGSGSHHGGYGAESRIKSALTGAETHIGSRDFRVRPETGEIDPQSGPSQFGRDRDDWGNWFGVQNSFPAWHYVLADHYLRRNPHFAPPDPRKILTPANPRVFGAAPSQQRFHSFEQAGRFTSACSVMVYRDELLFPRGETQHVFTCEPVHNLVQHNVLTADGTSFELRRDGADGELDFLASEDPWCRPVMVRTGPDGALWVVDMYRYMIEHPEWLPQAGKEAFRPMYRAGDDRGRIYRVFPKDKKPARMPKLAGLKTAELVAALESPGGWHRDMAQRLLIERNDRSSILALARLAESSASPLARLHAMCTLDGLNGLDASILQKRLSDSHPGVRRQALRLAEPLGKEAAIVSAAIALADDADAALQLQLAYTLGQWSSPEAARTLARLAISSSDDPYCLAAVMSSLNKDSVVEVLRTVRAEIDKHPAKLEQLLGRMLEQAISLGRDDSLAEVLPSVATGTLYEPWQLTAVAFALDGLKHGKRQDQLAAALKGLQPVLDQARQVAASADSPIDRRVSAVRLLLRGGQQRDAEIKTAAALLKPQTPAELQQALVEHLAEQNDSQIAELLLSGWPAYTAARRSQILKGIAGRREWIQALLTALDQGTVNPAEIDPIAREQLLAHQDAGLRQQLVRRLAGASNNRQQILEQFKTALTLPGDAARGLEVFRAKCAACHKHGDVGSEVGPNLDSLTDRTPATLLDSILDPNRALEAKYVSYAAATEDGRVRSGMISVETGNSITLIGADGKAEIILRNELEELRSTGKSLMPEGLEKDLTAQDLADLLTILGKRS